MEKNLSPIAHAKESVFSSNRSQLQATEKKSQKGAIKEMGTQIDFDDDISQMNESDMVRLGAKADQSQSNYESDTADPKPLNLVVDTKFPKVSLHM